MISVGDSTFTGTRSAAGSSRVRGGDVGAGVPGPVASVSDGSGSGSGSRRSGRRGTGASAFGATGACVVEGTGACAFGGADTTGSASGASLSGASVSGGLGLGSLGLGSLGLGDVGLGDSGLRRLGRFRGGHGNLAGQFRNRDAAADATAAASAGAGIHLLAVAGQQLRDGDLPGVGAAAVRHCETTISSPPHLGVELAENEPLAQGPGTDIESFHSQRAHGGLRDEGTGDDLLRPVGAHALELGTVRGRHAGDECDELTQPGGGQGAPHPGARRRRGGTGQPCEGAEGLRAPHAQVGSTGRPQLLGGPDEFGIEPVPQHRDAPLTGRVLAQPVPSQAPGTELQRERHIGVLVAAEGQLQGAAADVQAQDASRAPAVPPPHREERQPGLVHTGEHLERDAGLGADATEHRVGVGGIAHRGGRERHQLLASGGAGDAGEVGDRLDQPVGALRGDVTAVVRVLGQAQGCLRRAHGGGMATAMSVHHE